MSAGWEMEFEFECGMLIDGGGKVDGGIGDERECERVGKNGVES